MPVPAVAAVKYATAVRRVRRAEAKMGPVRYRISKTHGRLMVFVAFIFDLMPIIFLLGTVALVGFTLSEAVGGSCEESALNTFLNFRLVSWETGSLEFFTKGTNSVTDLSTTCGAATGVAYASGAFAGIAFGPMLLFVGSVLGVMTAFLLFVFWFAIKRVNVLKPTAKNLFVSFGTFICESIPILNILIPSITLTTWHHVRTSQKEDRKKYKKKQKQMRAAIQQQQNAEQLMYS